MNYVLESALVLSLITVLVHNKRGTEYKFVYVVASLMLVQQVADITSQIITDYNNPCS
jgi:hypothetical protein